MIARAGDDESSALAQLICDEVDRIHRLTDRIDPFGAFEPPRFDRFNIHEALDRVRKLIGSSAREQMQKLIAGKVYLELFVKVQPKWRQSRLRLAELGYRVEE